MEKIEKVPHLSGVCLSGVTIVFKTCSMETYNVNTTGLDQPNSLTFRIAYLENNWNV